MIKEGAKLVTSVNDILEYYPQISEKKWKKDTNFKNIKKEYLPIYNLLKQKEYSLEEIIIKIDNVEVSKVSSILTMMEIEGIIEKQIGLGYKLKEKF